MKLFKSTVMALSLLIPAVATASMEQFNKSAEVMTNAVVNQDMELFLTSVTFEQCFKLNPTPQNQIAYTNISTASRFVTLVSNSIFEDKLASQDWEIAHRAIHSGSKIGQHYIGLLQARYPKLDIEAGMIVASAESGATSTKSAMQIYQVEVESFCKIVKENADEMVKDILEAKNYYDGVYGESIYGVHSIVARIVKEKLGMIKP